MFGNHPSFLIIRIIVMAKSARKITGNVTETQPARWYQRNVLTRFVIALLLTAGFADAAGEWRGPRVVVIGVDGLSVDGVNTANMPNLRRLMQRAAWSLAARAVLPTLSSPNWESIITGAGVEQHGITSNGYLRHLVEFQPSCQGPDGKYPTIFRTLRDQYPEAGIAIFHDWGGFADLVEERAPDVMRHVGGAARTTAAAVAYWKERLPALLFIHLDSVDHAGHASGWGSKEYYKAVEEADRYIGEIVATVESVPAGESTFVLVTSDHGGTRKGHGKNSLPEIEIPWVLAGPDVVAGHIDAPVQTFDTAATLAWIFGLEPMKCAIGRPVLAAFGNAALSTASSNGPANCAPQRTAPGLTANTVPAGGQVHYR
jgi:Type I phosphodiesterase / nucleotide pyrophosphatase